MSALAITVISILGLTCFVLALMCLVLVDRVRADRSWYRRTHE